MKIENILYAFISEQLNFKHIKKLQPLLTCFKRISMVSFKMSYITYVYKLGITIETW